jgi:hypothetical protein
MIFSENRDLVLLFMPSLTAISTQMLSREDSDNSSPGDSEVT